VESALRAGENALAQVAGECDRLQTRVQETAKRFRPAAKQNERMTRLVHEVQQRPEDVFLDRVAPANVRREVFEKNADLHLCSELLSNRAARPRRCATFRP